MTTTTVELPQVDQDTISLFSVGTLVNLRIGTWSGRKMLSRQDMTSVGIDPDALPKDIVNLGRKLLVPKSELQVMTHLEQRARKYLAKWSVPFGIADCHFVPMNMLEDVEGELKSIKEAFFKGVDSFILRFGDMRDVVKDKHPEFWEKCLRQHYPPTPELLRKKFKFDWYMFRIAGMNSIQESDLTNILAGEEVKQERVKELRGQMQGEVSNFVNEYATSMRTETIKFCELMTARVNGQPYGEEIESKKLTPRSLSMFKKYVDRFKNMNIFGDQEIEKMLNQFRDQFLDLGVKPSDLDSHHMKSSITSSLAEIRKAASLEGEGTSQFLGQLKRKITL